MGGQRQIGFRAPDELIARIDAAAADVPRERYLRRVVVEHIDTAAHHAALETAARDLEALWNDCDVIEEFSGGGARLVPEATAVLTRIADCLEGLQRVRRKAVERG